MFNWFNKPPEVPEPRPAPPKPRSEVINILKRMLELKVHNIEGEVTLMMPDQYSDYYLLRLGYNYQSGLPILSLIAPEEQDLAKEIMNVSLLSHINKVLDNEQRKQEENKPS